MVGELSCVTTTLLIIGYVWVWNKAWRIGVAQDIRQGKDSGVNFVVAMVWPLVVIGVGIAIVVFDVTPPGFIKLPALPSSPAGDE